MTEKIDPVLLKGSLKAFERLKDQIQPNWRKENKENPCKDDIPVKSFSKQLDEYNQQIKIALDNNELITFHKLSALVAGNLNDEPKAISHLVESQGLHHRTQVRYRYIKSEIKKNNDQNQSVYGLDPSHFDLGLDSKETYDKLLLKLKQLPSEWYMLQVTKAYNKSEYPTSPSTTHPIHLVVLPTGKNAIPPFTLLLPKPKNNNYDIVSSIKTLLDNNKKDLSRSYTYKQQYWQMRFRQNETMKTAIDEIEKNWLREWRILFIADPIEPSYTTKDLLQIIDKLIIDDKKINGNITIKQIWLLKKIASCSSYLNKEEIDRAVTWVLNGPSKLCKNIIYSIIGKTKFSSAIETEIRKTLVLIVDEFIDYLPFESMSILIKNPVTRFSCFHMVYALFKEYEKSIINGCLEIKLDDCTDNGLGTFVVNPSGDLEKMEKRMKVFIDDWLPNWDGIYHAPPTTQQFIDALSNYTFFMYNGHGSGMNYLPRDTIEKTRAKAIPLLFGCSSLKMLNNGGKFPPISLANQYLTACSPCILGMIWEITDLAADKLTVNFITNFLPSKSKNVWKNIDDDKWSKGLIENEKSCKLNDICQTRENEMLRAISLAKNYSKRQYMTAVATIVRGLPVRICHNK